MISRVKSNVKSGCPASGGGDIADRHSLPEGLQTPPVQEGIVMEAASLWSWRMKKSNSVSLKWVFL